VVQGQGRSSWIKIAPGSTHDHVGLAVGASPTGPTSNGQPNVEDFMAGSMGRGSEHPQNGGYLCRPLLLPECTCK
jgi:hypothetical protein